MQGKIEQLSNHELEQVTGGWDPFEEIGKLLGRGLKYTSLQHIHYSNGYPSQW